MSVLRRVIVRETRGIRRFLYPLTAEPALLQPWPPGNVGLFSHDGRSFPVQVSPASSRQARIDFAVSLAPFESLELELLSDRPAASIDDPLNVTVGPAMRSTQRRFEIVARNGMPEDVVYDGIRFLKSPLLVSRNSESMAIQGDTEFQTGPITARTFVKGVYSDGCECETSLEITACKSWALLGHVLSRPHAGDEIMFSMQLAVASPILTFDCGVGSGTYGKLPAAAAEEVVWHSTFSGRPAIKWSISNAGRTDYLGEVEQSDDFREQRWFHLIDSNKSLAVAITKIALACREMSVRLRSDGTVLVSFRLGENDGAPACFGLCYHFLNDIPAIAAATSPKSILFPPEVKLG